MLIESTVLEAITVIPTAPPLNASVTFENIGQATQKIKVPVFPYQPDNVSQGKVFAPSFIVPKGMWTVVYEVQLTGVIFTSVTHTAPSDPGGPLTLRFPKGLAVGEPTIAEDGTTCSTDFNTTQITDVNKLSCHFELAPKVGSGFERFSKSFSGDPTIAVVSDPLG